MLECYRGIDEDSFVIQAGKYFAAVCTGSPQWWWVGRHGLSQSMRWHVGLGPIAVGRLHD